MLQYLGIQPGGKIELVLDLLPHGKAVLKAARPKRSFHELQGFKGKTDGKRRSLREIDEAIAQAGAAAGARRK